MSETNLILPVSSCRANLSAIQSSLEEVTPNEPNKVIDRLNELSSLLGTSAQVLSSYQFHVDTMRFEAVKQAKDSGYSGNMAKEFCEGYCAELRSELKLAERQNAALVHCLDAGRSLLSYIKADNFNTNMQR